MNVSQELFQLIKSMSRQEKRYFKIFASTHSRERDTKAIALFNAIDRQQEHDEEELRRAFGSEISARSLASAKYNLNKLLLKCLAAYHGGKSADAELREMLSYVEVLYNRGLYSHCGKVIARARKKATRHQKYIRLLELYPWEKKLLNKAESDSPVHDMRKHYKEVRETLGKINNSIEFLELDDTLVAACILYARSPSERNLEELEQIHDHPLLRSDAQAHTVAAKISYWCSRGSYEWTKQEFRLAREYYAKALSLFYRDETRIHEDIYGFKRVAQNYLTACIATKKFDDFLVTIGKAKALPLVSLEDEINAIEIVCHLELSFYLNFGLLDEALVAVRRCEEGLRAYAGKILPGRGITLHHNCSVVHFFTGDYNKSLEHCNAILNLTKQDPKRDIRHFARVFRLIIHFELENYDTLETLIRSTDRFLQTRDALSKLEKVLLRFLRKLLNCPDRASELRVFHSLRETLVELLHHSDDKEPVGLIEMLFWVESKLQNKTTKEVYKGIMSKGKELDKRSLFPLKENKNQGPRSCNAKNAKDRKVRKEK